ncbi:MAG TPA: hypothetical protein VIC26_11160 [Marinagarivorans sp.]
MQTEAGQRVLGYTQDIFSKGRKLKAPLHKGVKPETSLRMGVLSIMSRNFIETFIVFV